MSHKLSTIFSNTLAQLVAKFFGAGLTFLTTIVIIRLSGTTLFGNLTKALALIAIGFTIIDFGINAVAVRNFARTRDLVTGFGDLLILRLSLSIFVVILLNLLLWFMPGSYNGQIISIFWLGSLSILFQGVFTSCNAIFQFRENYWYSTISIVMGTTFGAALTYYFALNNPTISNFLLANTLGYIAMSLASLSMVKIPLRSLRPSLSRLKSLLTAALPLGIILLASVFASKLDNIVLGIYRSSSELGEYGFAYRIFDVILVLPVFIMNAAYPRLVKETATNSSLLIRRISVLMLTSGVMIATLSYLLAPYLLLIRPELTLSVLSLRLLVLSLPLFFLTAPLMWQRITQRRESSLLKIYLAAALINVTLNLVFTPTHGVTAAAIITGLTELFIYLSLTRET